MVTQQDDVGDMRKLQLHAKTFSTPYFHSLVKQEETQTPTQIYKSSSNTTEEWQVVRVNNFKILHNRNITRMHRNTSFGKMTTLMFVRV